MKTREKTCSNGAQPETNGRFVVWGARDSHVGGGTAPPEDDGRYGESRGGPELNHGAS